MQLSFLGRQPVTFLCLRCFKCVEGWSADELQSTLTSSGHWETNISIQVNSFIGPVGKHWINSSFYTTEPSCCFCSAHTLQPSLNVALRIPARCVLQCCKYIKMLTLSVQLPSLTFQCLRGRARVCIFLYTAASKHVPAFPAYTHMYGV